MNKAVYIKTKIAVNNLEEEDLINIKYLKFLEELDIRAVTISHELLHEINEMIERLLKNKEFKNTCKGMLNNEQTSSTN